MQREFSKTLKSKRQIKQISNLYLYRKAERPGVLVEVGFLSNSNERYLLRQDSYQQKIADTIKKLILDDSRNDEVITLYGND